MGCKTCAWGFSEPDVTRWYHNQNAGEEQPKGENSSYTCLASLPWASHRIFIFKFLTRFLLAFECRNPTQLAGFLASSVPTCTLAASKVKEKQKKRVARMNHFLIQTLKPEYPNKSLTCVFKINTTYLNTLRRRSSAHYQNQAANLS